VYREPAQVVLDKVIDHVDDGVRSFVERSPLVVLATGDGMRNDASPRGGPPGFVRVVDEHRLAFGDLVGNNRIDTYRNLVEHPGIGMLFMIPGLLETLRVNGTAVVSTDPALRELCAIDGRVPKVAISIAVQECYIQCGAALRRASVWDQSTWPDDTERPRPAAIHNAHIGIDVPAEVIEQDLADYYEHGAWEVGGTPDG
jgi:hypothetical protein